MAKREGERETCSNFPAASYSPLIGSSLAVESSLFLSHQESNTELIISSLIFKNQTEEEIKQISAPSLGYFHREIGSR